MHVTETRAAAQGKAAGASATARFGAALRAARAAAERRQAGAGAIPAPESPLVGRRASAAGADSALRARRAVFHEEERQAPSPQASLSPTPPSGDPPPPAELRAVVRALPPAIEASRVREGAPLTLAFGRSLSVDVRAGAHGVEVVLRAERRLAGAARAELPALVEALRARGIRVARAEVLPRPDARPAGVRAR